jgi:DNA-binding SARP family transcriptional activator
VQLCGPYVVTLDGRRIDPDLPGRQGRLLFAYLVLSRPQPVSRDLLIDALWGDRLRSNAGSALTVLVSKARAVLGAEVLPGRAELRVALPEPSRVDVEVASSALHQAESAVALADWRRAWPAALSAQYVARRRFLPESETGWAESWRRRLAEVHVRAMECYATACLGLSGTELPAAERAARQLVEMAPLRETGHLLLMRALLARGNVAEALAAYARLSALLREELGVGPCAAAQQLYTELLD